MLIIFKNEYKESTSGIHDPVEETLASLQCGWELQLKKGFNQVVPGPAKLPTHRFFM